MAVAVAAAVKVAFVRAMTYQHIKNAKSGKAGEGTNRALKYAKGR